MGSFGPTASLDMDFEWCDKEQAAHPGRRGQNSAARSAAIGVNTMSCSKPVPVLKSRADVYPQDRIEAALKEVELPPSYRIMLRGHLTSPLGTTPADSRFCRKDDAYGVLYAASDFATAFIETVVRDRFMHRRRREIGLAEVTKRGWARIQTTRGTRLLLLDLRHDGCTLIGAPTDVVNARNHAAGRAFGRVVHAQHASVEGLLYASRLTGSDVYAVFDRGISKLEVREFGMLQDHPDLPDLLEKDGIDLVVGQ